MVSVIFDLDGTLIDSAPDIHAAVNRMLQDEGAAPMPMDQVRSFIGNGVPMLIERVMVARGETVEPARHAALETRFMTHYGAAPADLTRVYPGVRDALAALVGAGHRLALCTNKPVAPARAILESFGLAQHFDALIGGDSLAVRKPDPMPLLAAASALGKARAFYVGDSEVDAEAAAAAGMPLILFTEGYRKLPVAALTHAAAFDRFADLPGILARLAGPAA